MALFEKTVLESCRAAALSCHSAAGLMTSLRGKSPQVAVSNEACRLLRQAEALCRNATALVLSQHKKSASGGNGGGAAGNVQTDTSTTSLSKKEKKKQKKKSKKKQLSFMEVDGDYGASAGGIGGGSATAAAAPAVVPGFGSPQQLEALTTMLGSAFNTLPSASGSALGGPETPSFFPLGTQVVISGLTAQPDYNNKAGQIVHDPGAPNGDGRMAVKLEGSGKRIRVSKTNLMLSANQPVAATGFTSRSDLEDEFADALKS